jgi:hypothetical protein
VPKPSLKLPACPDLHADEAEQYLPTSRPGTASVLWFVMSTGHHFRQEQGHRRRVTAIPGNVHDDVVTPAVTIPPAGTGSPTPGLAAPSTGGSLQMVTARLRQPREYPPIWREIKSQ